MKRALTILELLIVLALLSLSTSFVCLNLLGAAPIHAIQSAADQLAALFATAQVTAAHSSLPCMLTCDEQTCRLRKMALEDENRWVDGPDLAFVRTVRVAGFVQDGEESPGGLGPPWAVSVLPDHSADWIVWLRHQHGLLVKVTVDGWTGEARLEVEHGSAP